jgi:hypothetical protein
MTATKPTARDVAREYSAEAAWVPFAYCWPPIGETVEVLYMDGVIKEVGRGSDGRMLPLGKKPSIYDHMEKCFWRPLPKRKA